MHIFRRKNLLLLIACGISFFAITGYSQDLSYDYRYRVEMIEGDKPPKITGMDRFDIPAAAKKNGVTGTVKASMVLGEDGKTRDIVVKEGLPDGVSEAVKGILQTLHFEPAQKDGRPVAAKLDFEFTITALYDENDKNVAKPKITLKPSPVIPPGEKVKGKVSVAVLFNENGTVKVLSTNSVMPKEYDAAAVAAAKLLEFTPAVHKKSKKNVSQQMNVDYEFK